MNTPHIVRAYEAGEDDGVYYLAMAYVKGESLADVLQRDAPLEERAALLIVQKIAGALREAWEEQNLLHRDIKPANILMNTKGEPLLADLGIAKRLDESDGLTQTGSVLGTPNYMSREQIEGRSDIDTRSDMYGLGTTFYHMLTGHMPFSGSTLVETAHQAGHRTVAGSALL